MMLSPQAARMGTVYTTLRKIGCAGAGRFGGSLSSSPSTPRFKSCLSANVDNLAYSHSGLVAAAEYRARNITKIEQQEPWMINLGRGSDNAWLMGPRKPREWFTGVAPVDHCPGK